MGKLKKFLEAIGEYEEISILPDTTATGEVVKIRVEGNIDETDYEWGYLFLPKGTSIKKHKHTKDRETYVLIIGSLYMNGRRVDVDFCEINGSHQIDKTKETTIIKYSKEKILEKSNITLKNVKNMKKS